VISDTSDEEITAHAVRTLSELRRRAKRTTHEGDDWPADAPRITHVVKDLSLFLLFNQLVY
jgi:hypothetical protein